jgi:hypothetical protein
MAYESGIPHLSAANNLSDLTSASTARTNLGLGSAAVVNVPISSANGGTGVNNGTSTITLGGSLTTSGAFSSTFTMTNTTSVTFPTSGTLATTADIPSLPLSLSNGGTGASLTASNGGIFYSTATAGAILSGTATAGQMLQSGASTTPSWSTATYPATTTINQLLYSSSNNIVTGLSTANSGVLVTDSGGIPSISSTLPSAVQGNITSVGTIASGVWNGTAIDVAHGGTGRTTLTNHGVLVGAATTAITQLAAGSAGQVLQSGGASADPAYSTATYPSTATGTGTLLRADGTNWVATTSTYPNTNAVNTLLYASSANVMAALATANSGVLVTDSGGVPSISSTLPSAVQGNITAVGTIASGTWNGTAIDVAHGGTGRTTLTNHGVLVGAATTAITQLAAGSAGQVLQSGGASADPAYSTATYPTTATGTGTLLRADGTNWVATTSTYPNTNAVSTLLYASSANVMAALATANNSILVTDGSGVPSIGSTLPTAVQGNITSVGTIASGTWNGTAVDVAHGGTGNTTFTAYSIIAAGTTATGAFQNVSGVGTSGQVLTSNGASALPTWQGVSSPSPSTTVTLFDDFIGAESATTTTDCQSALTWRQTGTSAPFTTSGSGSAATSNAHPGILASSAMTASKTFGLFNGSAGGNGTIVLGGGAISMTWIFNIVTLSDSTNRYIMRLGFGDTSGADQVNGIYFEYSDNINSGKWNLKTASASTRSTTSSTTTVATGWHNFTITVNAAATSTTLTLDGVNLATIATNIPTAVVSPMFDMQFSLGTIAAGTFIIDAFWLTQTLTVAR